MLFTLMNTSWCEAPKVFQPCSRPAEHVLEALQPARVKTWQTKQVAQTTCPLPCPNSGFIIWTCTSLVTPVELYQSMLMKSVFEHLYLNGSTTNQWTYINPCFWNQYFSICTWIDPPSTSGLISIHVSETSIWALNLKIDPPPTSGLISVHASEISIWAFVLELIHHQLVDLYQSMLPKSVFEHLNW